MPAFSRAASSSPRFPGSRMVATTFQPRFPSSTEAARPMPELAPVTRTVGMLPAPSDGPLPTLALRRAEGQPLGRRGGWAGCQVAFRLEDQDTAIARHVLESSGFGLLAKKAVGGS